MEQKNVQQIIGGFDTVIELCVRLLQRWIIKYIFSPHLYHDYKSLEQLSFKFTATHIRNAHHQTACIFYHSFLWMLPLYTPLFASDTNGGFIRGLDWPIPWFWFTTATHYRLDAAPQKEKIPSLLCRNAQIIRLVTTFVLALRGARDLYAAVIHFPENTFL
jgi:hypothetical protein